MAKSILKIKARELRRQGKGIKEIAKLLRVSVGSVSVWCRDVILSEDQIANLKKRVTDPYYGGKRTYLESQKKLLASKIRLITANSINEVGRLSERDLLIAGVALYWGEGFKKDHQVGLATSDPYAAQFFILWLNKCFDIRKTDLLLRLTLNIQYKEDISNQEEHWSRQLGVERDLFSKPFFQKSIWKKVYENKNEYHGVVRIRVRRSMDLLRRIQGQIQGLIMNLEKFTL